MSSSSEHEYLENMGRPNWPGPVSLNTFLYPEPDTEVDVFLVVVRGQAPRIGTLTPHDQHWMFQWTIGTTKADTKLPVLRRLQIVQEKNLMGQGDLNHLTNWGAVTVVGEKLSPDDDQVNILLKSMTPEQRKEFETISNGTRVRKPDGNWNCQDWCKTVLETAVESGVLTQPEVDQAVRSADEVEIRPYTH
ncbi:hypothetical protein M413DRAFT_443510 [Hebeloma cylindrosporum]|uniref:Uncharacterized protein n=1 Tax=Hebeloma cylindrosporum TaxID=76867 RepID=A0A0C3CIV4_HEBCY|nr:hypothetical protein M413DRAFT_443510 [Hebeloma cylindrosporum h7]